MKKQILTALAVSTMMTLAMPFAAFAAGRSCQTGFRPGNNCSYTGCSAVSVARMQGSCAISNLNIADVYRLIETSCTEETCGILFSSGTICNTGCQTSACASGNSAGNCLISGIPGASCGSLACRR